MELSNKEKKRLQRQYGNWALITGASSAIGEAIAKKLAASGIHIILNAKRGLALAMLAETLEKNYAVQTKIIVADLSIEKEVNELLIDTTAMDVGLVVFASEYVTSGTFRKAILYNELDMFHVNCKALFMGVHHYTKRFKARGSGGIIMLSSIAGFQGSPNVAHYGATKAYVQSLGEALTIELKPDHIDVLTVAPGPVYTEFTDRTQFAMNMTTTPEVVALEALKALGKKSTVFPGVISKSMIFGLRLFPRWGKIRMMNSIMRKIKHS